MLALLSAGYMLGLLIANPCVSEVEDVPGKNETVAYKCYAPGNQTPALLKDQTRVPATVKPPKKVAHRCGAKTPVWYEKNGTKRYRCK